MSEHKPGFARGINNTQRVRLLALAADGVSVEEISNILRVDVDIVENWMPGEEEEKPKRKRRTRAEMEAARAAEAGEEAPEE